MAGGQVLVVVMVIVAGAQSSLGARGVTSRVPNWSFSGIVGNFAFGHLIL